MGTDSPSPPRPLQKIIPPIPPDLGAQGQCLVPLPSAVPLFSPAIGSVKCRVGTWEQSEAAAEDLAR
ncbi:hypothetical protein Celaphus_00000780, partial [Cervus elaphus hippelaphus]